MFTTISASPCLVLDLQPCNFSVVISTSDVKVATDPTKICTTYCTYYPHSTLADPVLTACTPSSRIPTSTPQHSTRNTCAAAKRGHTHTTIAGQTCSKSLFGGAMSLHISTLDPHTDISTSKLFLDYPMSCFKAYKAGPEQAGVGKQGKGLRFVGDRPFVLQSCTASR